VRKVVWLGKSALVVAMFVATLNAQDESAGIRIATSTTPSVVEIKTTKGAGTGFLVDSLGVVVTNDHVASSGDLISIKLANGDIYNVINKVAADPVHDISVLRIPGYNLPKLQLGDSEGVQVGQRIFVIGNPLGLQNTFTDGVVSAQRQFDGVRLFQVSAPISPGSSGSPVVNLNGEVIGIAVGKWRGGENLNFAVPINYARGLISLQPGTPVTTGAIDRSTNANNDSGLSGLWTSLTNGNELEIREDNDRLYVEFDYAPQMKQAGVFSLYDLKRTGAGSYSGIQRYRGYCTNSLTNTITTRYSYEAAIELTSVSPRRIEGRALGPKRGWNFCTGKPLKDSDREWVNFVWVRK
jgi:V8-like Glu-specific endopeptidase